MNNLFEEYIRITFDGDRFSDVKVEQFILNYSRFFPLDRDAPILDIGPGRGEMLIALARLGFLDVSAIDISEEVIERCRPLATQVVLIEDATRYLQGNEKSYSLITVLDVLEHMQKKEVVRFLSELRRNTRTDGKVIIQVPNMGGIFPSLHRYNDFTHEVCFNDHSLRQVLLAVGFKKIDFFPFENLIGSAWKCRIMKLMRDRILYPSCRCVRILDGSLNPEIMTPVFFAVAQP